MRLQMPDGSVVEVPQDTVVRSSLLRQAIESVDQDMEIPLVAPTGLLKSWLECLAILNTGASQEHNSITEDSFTIGYHPKLLQFLNV